VPNDRARGPSVADVTRAFIDEHPSIRDALRDDLVNFSALARQVQGEGKARNEEAITIACRRYQRDLARPTPEMAAVRAVLAGSRLEVHSNVALLRLRDDAEAIGALLALVRRTLPASSRRRLFEVLQGTRATTILCEESLLPSLLEHVPARLRLAVERGLAVIAFRSQPDVAETPGILSFMAEVLYRRGINSLETVSVHTDSIFVFHDRDVIRAYQTLSDLVPAGPPLGGAELRAPIRRPRPGVP
jgi:hypothetical protein